MIRPRLALIAALLPLVIAAGCSQQPPQSAAPKPIEANEFKPVADDLGRPVALKAPAKRIACIGPGAVEAIFAMGAGDRLVGRDQMSTYPPQAEKIPVIGDFKGPFLESTLAVKPDLIILQGETYDRVRAADWTRKLKAPVAVINATNVEDLAKDIEKTGSWLGLEEKARQVAKMDPLPKRAPLRAFIEIQRVPLWTAGNDTLVGDAVNTAGLTNVGGDAKGYKAYSLESLLTQKPDVYIVTDKPGSRAKILEDLRRQPGLKDLDCIKRGRLAVVDADLLLRPGPRLWQGIYALAEAAHKK